MRQDNLTMGRKQRLRLVIRGAVQGVGFRPFVFRLATEMGLNGYVNNSAQGVVIEIDGNSEELQHFINRINSEKPPRSFIQSMEPSYLDPIGYEKFQVVESETIGPKNTIVMPDIATCPDCVKDIFEKSNRRYRYPFTNCTNCGPRYSIIESLPYDRANTTMKQFIMCDECRAEYNNPLDRRFHAQPNACPACGPHLEIWDEKGKMLRSHDDALMMAVEFIRHGKIVAIKGIGGFQLIVDARNHNSVRKLRNRKIREEKPLALMLPTLEIAQQICESSSIEERLLISPESPIVLLKKKKQNIEHLVCDDVAPGNPYLGIMLPYSPLHLLLMKELDFPIVATSGNLSDEPICIDEDDALSRLKGIADYYLVHNRPIARHVDDSICREMMGREMVIRRARGYAPLPIQTRKNMPSILALGAHLKNTVSISIRDNIFISQHIGDLENVQSFDAFNKAVKTLSVLYDFKPDTVACDLHPDYISTRQAMKYFETPIKVQHHYAHILSCMAENEIEPPVLGVAWDGTGYGPDGTIWGGEFLLINEKSYERVGTFRSFPLPGGEIAVKEPRRAALGMLYEIYGDELWKMESLPLLKKFSSNDIKTLKTMLKKDINCPKTSSVGRIFDAISSLLGIRQKSNFEGQAAMELEFAIDGEKLDDFYDLEISQSSSRYIIEWKPMMMGIMADVQEKIATGIISAKFHNTMTRSIIEISKKIGEKKVVLSGGCFQNKYLTEKVIGQLRNNDFVPYWHQRIPTNDGGISLGQIVAAVRENSEA